MEILAIANSEEATAVCNRHATDAAPDRTRTRELIELLPSGGQVCDYQRQNWDEDQHEHDETTSSDQPRENGPYPLTSVTPCAPPQADQYQRQIYGKDYRYHKAD